jgi:hypothetical protein
LDKIWIEFGVGGLWCLALLSTIFELEKENQVCKARFSVLLFVQLNFDKFYLPTAGNYISTLIEASDQV